MATSVAEGDVIDSVIHNGKALESEVIGIYESPRDPSTSLIIGFNFLGKRKKKKKKELTEHNLLEG